MSTTLHLQAQRAGETALTEVVHPIDGWFLHLRWQGSLLAKLRLPEQACPPAGDYSWNQAHGPDLLTHLFNTGLTLSLQPAVGAGKPSPENTAVRGLDLAKLATGIRNLQASSLYNTQTGLPVTDINMEVKEKLRALGWRTAGVGDEIGVDHGLSPQVRVGVLAHGCQFLFHPLQTLQRLLQFLFQTRQ